MEDDSINYPLLQNKYKIIDYLNKGGFSKVYLVEDIDTNKKYAAKLLNMEKVNETNFKKEIQILKKLSSLNHPYIVNYIDSGEEDIILDSKEINKQKYIILENVSKGELFQYIKANEKGFEKETAQLIFYKIIKAIEAIHKEGICHRDLKIDNILMDEDFNPKISDFGLAAELKGKLKDKVGTKNYKAPEMYRKGKYDGDLADIFSLGVILLILNVGNIGFRESKKTEYYYKYIYNNKFDDYWNITGYTELDEDVKRLYWEMVSFNPDDRPSIQKILNSPLMKEIADLNDEGFKKREKDVREEFEKIEGNINAKNENENKKIKIENNNNNIQQPNKGMSETNERKQYFKLNLIPKMALKTGRKMKHYMKIIGNVEPCKLMNCIANEIDKKYEDKIDIIPNKYKLKFDVIFKNNEKEKDEEENNNDEENNDEENNEEENEQIEYEINESIIQLKLFESLNGVYIVRFAKKNGDIINYYKYLDELRNIIKEMEYV